ncbi:two-component system, OmpR family, phosphate regulon sensor histidine kinase PhoR [Thermoflexales bacterium]|nr:two-component system, OmpR family, phosphate regulon sensor histidine kinase PhoR [Thermoflexales bacterium]
MTDKRILVADDAEAIRDMLGSFLANLGYHTDLAEDGQAAIELFQSHPYHVIICDLQMPRVEGLGVLARVKAIDPDVQVIILTGHATLETAIEALRLGAYEYQFKPVENMEIFARLVERAYTHQRLLCENKQLLKQLQDANAHLESEVDKRTRELRTANESLRSLDRLKSDFVSVVSHELRTPLAVVTLEAQMLASGMQFSPEKLREMHQALLVSARRLQIQIDDLLDFALIERGELELKFTACSINQIVRDVVDLYSARAAEKHLKVTLTLPPTAQLSVIADGPRLRSALMHLLDNAIKFTAAYGTVTVSVHNLVFVPDTEIPAVAVSVRDTGIGISSDTQQHLFSAFNQADMSTTRRFGGMGMGLALAKRIAEAHGGKITFKSDAGQGSLFALWIPVRPPQSSTTN